MARCKTASGQARLWPAYAFLHANFVPRPTLYMYSGYERKCHMIGVDTRMGEGLAY